MRPSEDHHIGRDELWGRIQPPGTPNRETRERPEAGSPGSSEQASIEGGAFRKTRGRLEEAVVIEVRVDDDLGPLGQNLPDPLRECIADDPGLRHHVEELHPECRTIEIWKVRLVGEESN